MSVNWLQPLRPFVQQLGAIIDALDTDLQGYVDSWLEAHPEATTTVEDDSLTTAKYKDESVTLAKLNDDVLAYIATHGIDAHGYYPYMLVGGADALTSGAVDEAMWQRREIDAPNGIAKVQSVKGNTVAWNQLFPSNSSTETQGVTFTNNGDGSYTVDGTAIANAVTTGISNFALTANNKYLVLGTSGDVTVSVYGTSAHNAPTIFTESTDRNAIARLVVYSGGTADNVTVWPQLFDLTQMFGAGNEPTTVAEFEQMFPESYYAYSAPTLKPVSITGIATTDADGNALDERSIPVSTYFPTGMKRAGISNPVYDELTNQQAITRVGAVDLGTLAWTLASTSVFRAAKPSAAKTGYRGRCAKYTFIGQSSTPSDKEMSSGGSGEYIVVQDTAYTDAATFKTAMSGVYLYYELATPTTVTIDPPLNLTYRTAEGGTESIVTAEGVISAPPTMSVVYPKIINGDALGSVQLIRPNLGDEKIIDVPVTLEPAIIGEIEIEPEVEEVQTDDIEEG